MSDPGYLKFDIPFKQGLVFFNNFNKDLRISGKAAILTFCPVVEF